MFSQLPLEQEESGLRALGDEQVAERVLAGEPALFEILMRRYNRRLFRVAFSILHSPTEAEDVVQETYVRAYLHLDSFEKRSSFATWLTKIAVYEALKRRKKQAGRMEFDEWTAPIEESDGQRLPVGPEKDLLNRELKGVLEEAIAEMPAPYRVIFVLRAVEGLSTAETAECLEISESLAKVRFFRARVWLQKRLLDDLDTAASQVLQFAGDRCDRVVAAVYARIA